jgi:hypothetical protein
MRERRRDPMFQVSAERSAAMQSSNWVLIGVGLAALGANLLLSHFAATIARAVRALHDRRRPSGPPVVCGE